MNVVISLFNGLRSRFPATSYTPLLFFTASDRVLKTTISLSVNALLNLTTLFVPTTIISKSVPANLSELFTVTRIFTSARLLLLLYISTAKSV